MDMDWAHYHTISALVEGGRHPEALDRLRAFEAERGALPAPYVVLRGQALSHLRDFPAAVAALEAVVRRGDANFWIWYYLAEARRGTGDWDGVFAASREAHALAGWPESPAHGYRFTHDYFAANLLDWQDWFTRHVHAAPIRALEIGSWQGGSACWLLDRVVGPRGGRLTCIDPFTGSSEHGKFLLEAMAGTGSSLEAVFDDNIGRTGHTALVRKLKGFSQEILPLLQGELFDFVYIDGAHEAKWVIQDAILCWGLLAPGGLMLFDDVAYTFADYPEQDTARAVEFFTSVFRDDLAVVESGRQLLLRRHR